MSGKSIADAHQELGSMDPMKLEAEPPDTGAWASLLDHDIEAVPSRMRSEKLVWKCEQCDARGETLGDIPISCLDG